MSPLELNTRKSRIWTSTAGEISRIGRPEDVLFETPERPDEVGALVSPSSRRSNAETYVTGSIMVHPNFSKQQYEVSQLTQNLEQQIGVNSPSLASFGSPPMRNIAFSNVKTNSAISSDLRARDAQLRSNDPIREVICERPLDDESYERVLANKTKSVMASKESSFRLPPVPSDSQTPRSNVPAKARPFP